MRARERLSLRGSGGANVRHDLGAACRARAWPRASVEPRLRRWRENLCAASGAGKRRRVGVGETQATCRALEKFERDRAQPGRPI